MPKEIKLQENVILNGEEYVRAVDGNGVSVLIPIGIFSQYVTNASYFAIYDGATDVSPYSETTANVADIDMPLRWGLSGPLTDTSYWINSYGDLLVNNLAAPNSSQFDFRLLTTLGTYVEFEIEFDVRLADDSAYRLDRSIPIDVECVFPNGDIQTRSFTIPNEYVVTTVAPFHRHKITFSSYIKDVLLDNLMGGNIRLWSTNALGVSEILTVKDLTMTVKLF